MKLIIKSFDVDLEVKTKGVEIAVCDLDTKNDDGTITKGKQIGDVILNNRGLTWCKGRTGRPKGKKKTWKEVIAWMESGK